MKTNQLLTLLLLAIVLVGIAFWYGQREEKALIEAAAETRQVTAGLTSNTVERIEIKVPDAELVTLSKRDATWYTDPVKQHKADKNMVNGIFNAIEKEIEGVVVSKEPENFDEYQVGETSGTRVRIFGQNDKLLKDIYVGKAGPSFFTTFVREADRQEVINANASLAYVFNKPEGWRDKSIIDLQGGSITSLEAEGTSSSFVLRKIEGEWRAELPPGRQIQAGKAQTIASTASSLRATDFVDAQTTAGLSEFGLDPPRQKLAIGYEDRSTSPPVENSTVLLIGNQDETGNYYIKRADSDQIYTIGESQARTLSMEPDELFAAEDVPAPQDDATTAPVEQPAPVEAAPFDEFTSPTAARDQTLPTKQREAAEIDPEKLTSPTISPPADVQFGEPAPAPEATVPVATDAGETTPSR